MKDEVTTRGQTTLQLSVNFSVMIKLVALEEIWCCRVERRTVEVLLSSQEYRSNWVTTDSDFASRSFLDMETRFNIA